MSGTHADDKEKLEKVSDIIRRALRHQMRGCPVEFRSSPAKTTNTDGWYVEIAVIKPLALSLQVWLDHWAGSQTRYFWFGFSASEAIAISNVIKSYPLPIDGRHFVDSDVEKIGTTYSISKALSEIDFLNYPIQEYYADDKACFFGIYDVNQELDDIGLSLSRAVEFFLTTTRALPGFHEAHEIDRDLEGLPTERRRKEYVRAVRLVQQFVRQRIEEGKLFCEGEDCSFDPCKRVAGTQIEPRSLLDVHHKNPLALGGARWTELSDLTLLCPTCHRFAHAQIRARQTISINLRRNSAPEDTLSLS